MAVTETDKLNKGNTNTIDISNARAIIFDRRWDYNINNVWGYVELRVLENPQTQQCQFAWSVAAMGFIPLQYNVDVNGDSYREFALPSDSRLMVDITNFRTSRRQTNFDLLIELKLPLHLGAPIRVFNDTIHCAVPTTNMVEEQLRAQGPDLARLERALASIGAYNSPTALTSSTTN